MKMHVARSLVVVATLSFAVGGCSAGEGDSTKNLSVGLTLSEDAVAADAGLPAYPGAKSYKERGDSSSANVGLSTAVFGLKVVAMNLEAADPPEKVAAFYRQALSKYGTVVECSDAGAGSSKSQPGAAKEGELECQSSDDPGTHSIVYKVGTEENQRIVAIKPHGSGTRFSLVHLDVRGESKQ